MHKSAAENASASMTFPLWFASNKRDLPMRGDDVSD